MANTTGYSAPAADSGGVGDHLKQPPASVAHERQPTAKEPRRIAWLHVPKCGSTFAVTLMHYAVPELPADFIGSKRFLSNLNEPAYAIAASQFDRSLTRRIWMKPPSLSATWGGNWADHHALTDSVYEEWRGAIFGMFREPESLLESMWRFFGPSFFRCRGGAKHFASAELPIFNVSAYAARVAGSAVLQVAGQRHGYDCVMFAMKCQAAVPNVSKAIARLEGFAFVGLTGLWNASICLFHAMMQSIESPGPVSPLELQISRPTRSNAHSGLPDGAPQDEAYRKFYAACRRRFCNDWLQYNMSSSACADRAVRVDPAAIASACGPREYVGH